MFELWHACLPGTENIMEFTCKYACMHLQGHRAEEKCFLPSLRRKYGWLLHLLPASTLLQIVLSPFLYMHGFKILLSFPVSSPASFSGFTMSQEEFEKKGGESTHKSHTQNDQALQSKVLIIYMVADLL